jgi:hypothetical protein
MAVVQMLCLGVGCFFMFGARPCRTRNKRVGKNSVKIDIRINEKANAGTIFPPHRDS